jgi:phenylacetate-CoA ligase
VFKYLRATYEHSPAPFRRLAQFVPYAWLVGRPYRDCLALCRRLDTASSTEVRAFQERELGILLRYAVDCVPAYYALRSAVDRHRPFDALREFPLLSKEQVQADPQRFVSVHASRIPHHRATTGGTTGSQLCFLEDDATYAREMAFIHSMWSRVGYSPSARKATFRGVSFARIGDGTYWQENPIHNELQFSPFHLHEDALPRYIERLRQYRPAFLHGYPSAIDVVAEYALRSGDCRTLPPIKAALLGSEGCTPAQRERISRAFSTRVFTWYGHSERSVLAGECEQSGIYHHIPAYGTVELLLPTGQSCRSGETGELVGTGFSNRVMPLIRYRTEDLATREPPNCACGRGVFRFSGVQGRWNIESVFGRGGNQISAAALNMHGDLFENVIRYQYFQQERGSLEIRLMVNPDFSDADRARIVRAHQRKLWGELEVSARVVEDLPLTGRGKHRRVVCEAARI